MLTPNPPRNTKVFVFGFVSSTEIRCDTEGVAFYFGLKLMGVEHERALRGNVWRARRRERAKPGAAPLASTKIKDAPCGRFYFDLRWRNPA